MSEFKGTKGNWSINHWEKGESGITCIKTGKINYFSGDAVYESIFGIRSKILPKEHNIMASFEGAHIADVNDCGGESKANALLISKSPKMLEMLEKVYNLFDKLQMPTEQEINTYKKNIEKLIKEATEI